jgi:AAA ATPase domain
LSHAKQRTDFEGFSRQPDRAVRVTKLPRPEESPVARGPHRTKTFKDGYQKNDSVMVGREYERHLRDGLVSALHVGGGAAVILGEPGMGKTSLLGLLRIVQSAITRESSPHAALNLRRYFPSAAITDLLWPLQEHLATLPAIQREALEVCLALSAGPPRGPLAACARALGVLTAAADERPLVILVDDFQWLDAHAAFACRITVIGHSPGHWD